MLRTFRARGRLFRDSPPGTIGSNASRVSSLRIRALGAVSARRLWAMTADRLDSLTSFHPFTRLNGLLSGLKPPAGLESLPLSVGEPQQTPPPMIMAELQRTAEQWGKYPQAPGTAEFRQAVRDWLNRRYRLPAGMIDPDRQILPVAGTREALFM